MGKISKLTTFVIFSCFGILYGAEYDIKTITTIMDNYEKKIDSIKLRYSYESFVIDKEENRHFTRGSFAQKKSDGYVLLDEISQKGKTWDNNKEASGIARSYNGKVTRYLEHEKNNHGYHMAALYENHNPNLYKTRYNPYYFFWGINYKNKFTDLLNDPNGMVEIEGEEVVNGAKAIKINFKAAEGFLDCHLWLLPEKNYLPVKFTSFKATDEGRIKEMHWSEFKQFTGGIWYPMNINLYFKDVKEPVIVKIEEMDISPLTKEDFEFKFPEFTHVTDHVAGVSYLTTEPISRGEKTKCQTEQADNLNSKVFLDKYNLYNQKFQTIYYELETTIQTGIRKIVYTLEHCSRNKEKQWIGRVKYYNEDGTLDPYNNQLVVDTCDEKQWITLLSYSPEVENTRPPRATLWRSKRDKILQQNSETGSYGGPIAGRVWGSNGHSIYDLLKGASNLKLQNKVTKIIGYYTNLVDANTKYGIVKAWISPDVDYNCLKWEIIKEQNQFYRDGTTTDDKFTKWIASYYAEKVEQIDGQYIVTQARFNFTLKDGDKIISDHTYHYNLKNIDLNPDYEALGAFKIQLPEGTEVTCEDIPGRIFHWTDGKFVPDMEEYLLKNLTGKPLPSFSKIMTDFDPEQVAGKMVLVCFWDMEQRPSRNCIMQLAEQAEQFQQKGVTVVIVQASEVDEKKLNEWVKKNNIPFPVGIVQGDEEKIHLAWGVKSLPWLILTNREHQVVAEGITLQVLEDKLKTD